MLSCLNPRKQGVPFMTTRGSRSILGMLASVFFLLNLSCTDDTVKPAAQGEVLEFEISEKNVRNYFFRQGSVAAHALTTSGLAPRVVWAFPAENTGIGVWFYPPAQATEIVFEDKMTPVKRSDGMWGVSSTLSSDASMLRVKKAVLGNVRNVRDYFYGATIPPEFDYEIQQGVSF